MKLSILDYIDIFRVINDLKNKYGYSIIKRTIDFLERVKENELSFLDKEIWLLNTFYKYGVKEIDNILSFLDSIKDIYRYDSIIDWLNDIKDRYNISDVCFNVSKDNVINIESDTLHRVYGNVLSNSSFNNNKGLYSLKVCGEEPFIDVNTDNGERVLYISDFRINGYFNINGFNILEERCKVLLDFLDNISDCSKVSLNISGDGLKIISENGFIKIIISEEFYNYIKDNELFLDIFNKPDADLVKR